MPVVNLHIHKEQVTGEKNRTQRKEVKKDNVKRRKEKRNIDRKVVKIDL